MLALLTIGCVAACLAVALVLASIDAQRREDRIMARFHERLRREQSEWSQFWDDQRLILTPPQSPEPQ